MVPGATVTAEEFLEMTNDDGDGEESSPYVLEIYAQNWDTVQVFQGCLLHESIGFDRVLAVGIATSDIEAACNLLDIPKCERPDILYGSRLMSSAACAWLNKKRAPKKR